MTHINTLKVTLVGESETVSAPSINAVRKKGALRRSWLGGVHKFCFFCKSELKEVVPRHKIFLK